MPAARPCQRVCTLRGSSGGPNGGVRGQVRLVAPGSWATVWRHALPPGEEPLALAVLRLRDAVSGATHPLVAVGTCLALGEVGGPLRRRRRAGAWLRHASRSPTWACPCRHSPALSALPHNPHLPMSIRVATPVEGAHVASQPSSGLNVS